MRGYYPVGPTVLETGDVFGLHRRHRVIGAPVYVMVYPKILPLPQYDFASQRPIGEVRLQNRLFEDPTRTAGVRPHMPGDPLSRVHWRATARTGQLHCRIFEPTTLAGATLLVDFHTAGYPKRSEPHRSDIVITTAASIGYAVSVLNQPVGLVSNGRDAADRIRAESLEATPAGPGYETREGARERFELSEEKRSHPAGHRRHPTGDRPVPENPGSARPARTVRRAIVWVAGPGDGPADAAGRDPDRDLAAGAGRDRDRPGNAPSAGVRGECDPDRAR